MMEQVKKVKQDIADFKSASKVDQVIVLWTANTERFSSVLPGVNDSLDNLKTAIYKGHAEISPSTLYAYAAISSGCTYINGSPQNTFVPGLVEYAEQKGVFIAGEYGARMTSRQYFMNNSRWWFQVRSDKDQERASGLSSKRRH